MHLLTFDENGEPYLQTFSERNRPPYAVLSHTWESNNQEVTFRDILDKTYKGKNGWRKVDFCRNQAQKDKLDYIWVDSCCIDKSSSAEVTKAINSMFQWYEKAVKCYAYLADVSATTQKTRWWPEFRSSRWFTRGWTLQELLAPRLVEFYSVEGVKFGDKVTLERVIHEVTGIAVEALRGENLSKFSLEDRFIWAKGRETTEPEDKAYSLLGLFDVFMPLIYGEGEAHAMKRLRKTIVEETNSLNLDLKATVPDITSNNSEHNSTKWVENVGFTMLPEPETDCILHFKIGERDISDVEALTGVKLVISQHLRHVVLSSGLRIIPMPAIRFALPLSSTDDCLGEVSDDMKLAVKSSNTYRREKNGEVGILTSMSLVVSAKGDEDLVFELVVGRERGLKMWQQYLDKYK